MGGGGGGGGGVGEGSLKPWIVCRELTYILSPFLSVLNWNVDFSTVHQISVMFLPTSYNKLCRFIVRYNSLVDVPTMFSRGLLSQRC